MDPENTNGGQHKEVLWDRWSPPGALELGSPTTACSRYSQT